MAGLRTLAIVATAALLGGGIVAQPGNELEMPDRTGWPDRSGKISAMSYNIKGLPWPIAQGRDDALSLIGQQLSSMRSGDAQPHIVLLQEAFGDAPRSIGRTAGYRHIVMGPDASSASEVGPLGSEFQDASRWTKGEQSGSLINSGLAILSDYPVIKSRRYAFPEGACAGYDCLAAKGVLVAWVKVPGASQPVAVVNTHLNSRGSTGVPGSRADRAYAWQINAIRTFLSRALAPGTPVIFGGDFNTGQVPDRMAAVSRQLVAGNQIDGLATALSSGRVDPGSRDEARGLVERNKDKIFYRDGAIVSLRPEQAWVPFPVGTPDALSDHAGFVIDFSIEQ